MKEPAIWLFADTGRATEWSPDSKLTAVVETVVSRSDTRAFLSSAFWAPVGWAVQKFLAGQYVFIEVVTGPIDLPVFPVPVTKFDKNEVEKRFPEKAEAGEYQNTSNRVPVSHDKKVEDEFHYRRWTRRHSQVPQWILWTIEVESKVVQYLYISSSAE